MAIINEQYITPMTFVAIIVVALLVYGVMTMKDQRNAPEKASDAIHELPQGVDKAERQLEDRTPGQKLSDAIKDVGEKIKDSSQPSNN